MKASSCSQWTNTVGPAAVEQGLRNQVHGGNKGLYRSEREERENEWIIID